VGTNGRNGDRPHDDEPPALQAWVPGPGWQRRGAPLRRRRSDRRRWRLVLAGSGAALLLVAWGIAFTSGVRSVEPTVDDEDFLTDAEAVCEAARDRLTEAARARGDDELAPEEQATAVDATVDTLASMIHDLRDLRPAGADGEEVDAWLDDWERVLDSGRRTAEALRRDDRDAAEDAAVAGQDPARAVNAFAGANGLPACGTTPV
jgi:hypothetical protein